MDLDHFLRDPQSRRRFFRTSGVSVAGASAVFLAACSDDTKNPVKIGPDESDQADVEILNGALDLELHGRRGVQGRRRAAAGRAAGDRQAVPRAGAGARRRPRRRDQGRRRHAEPGEERLRLSRAALARPTSCASPSTSRTRRSPRTSTRCPSSRRSDLRATAASIITNEAEHVSVLLDALGREPGAGGVRDRQGGVMRGSRSVVDRRRRRRRPPRSRSSSATGASCCGAASALGGAAIAGVLDPAAVVGAQRVRRRPRATRAILPSAINLERVTVIAYDSVIAGGLLSPALRGVAAPLPRPRAGARRRADDGADRPRRHAAGAAAGRRRRRQGRRGAARRALAGRRPELPHRARDGGRRRVLRRARQARRGQAAADRRVDHGQRGPAPRRPAPGMPARTRSPMPSRPDRT